MRQCLDERQDDALLTCKCTDTFFSTSRQMKKIVRLIEAIPVHLSLDIVRLDDALGESWALPFQACTTWNVRLYPITKPFPLLISVVFQEPPACCCLWQR